MALQSAYQSVSGLVSGARHWSRRAAAVASRWWAPAAPFANAVMRVIRPGWRWLGATAVIRFCTSNLLRRIIVSNLIGLAILLFGLMYLTQTHSWLIDAKLESLKAQSEIIAQAIAADAKVENGRIVLDPDKLPEAEGALIPFRDDAFAALQLSIRPEVVTPVLRRVMGQTSNRARIYDRDGRLILDSATILSRGQIIRHETEPTTSEARPKTRNLWTKLSEFLRGDEIPIFRELENAHGLFYPMVRSALSGVTAPMLLLSDDGELIVAVAAPIRRAKAIHGALMLSTRPGEIDDVVGRERQAIVTLSVMALLAALAAATLLAQTVAEPMQRLSAAAEHASHDLKAARRLPDYSDRADEVGQISKAVTSLTSALFRRIEASEKFAADVAHELRNPLTAARSTAESLGYARNEDERRHLIVQIQLELKRLNKLITDVSNASRLDAELALAQLVPLDVSAVLTGVSTTFRDLLSGTGKTVLLEIEPAPSPKAYFINGDEGRLCQVATNLIDNAISFSPDNSAVRVGLRSLGSEIEFTVSDDGPGVDSGKLEKIFERFYTYRPTASSSRGNNSGLGLSISKEIVQAHGGRIWAENRHDKDGTGGPAGATFFVRIPAAGRRG